MPKPVVDADTCTGDANIDAVLKKSGIASKIGLTKAGGVYSWKGFCTAIRQYNGIGDRQIYLGDGDCKAGLSNIAALLAQAMWESGGDAPFSACDENNYSGTATASCTQRYDRQLYHSLVGQPNACAVDPNMQMTAVTYASWTPGPMKCEPGTATEKCCWWGRGAIQTTGPNNYGLLNAEVFQKIPELKHINLCSNPEGICDTSDGNMQKNWLGAVHYWAHNVQGYTNATYKRNFHESLKQYVSSGLNLQGSTYNGADFASGTGSVVNNGVWGTGAHGNYKRVRNFTKIIAALKQGGMATCGN